MTPIPASEPAALDRRQFIRVAGGGAIVAATAGAAGCAQPMPAAATAAWRGPDDETDVRRWLLSHAILAPHSHNLQSWLVDLATPGEIMLRCDLTRLLPETDPQSRQIMMSHGTFLALLDIAACERGLRTQTMLFPEGAFSPDRIDARPVARIRLLPDASLRPDPLFAQILRRRTNRSLYDLSRPVPAEAWHAMAQAAGPSPSRFGFVDARQPALLAQHRAIAAAAWRTELVTPRTMMESMRLMRVGAAEIAQHRDGISVLDPMLVALDRVGLFDRSRAPAPDSSAISSQVKDFGEKLASTPAFLWMLTPGNDRALQVEAGRAYARIQLAATAHGVSMQPLQQALQEYPEQAASNADIHRLLGAAPQDKLQMWARVGFAPPVGPAPRRGLAAQLVQR